MKQAYLIIAHNNFEHLKHLLRSLDCENVSFFLYIDAKSDIPEFIRNFKSVNPMTILNERIINWGTQSQVLSELDLFEKSFENSDIEWFHLISGSDFPIKPVKDINLFFESSEDVDCFMETEPLPGHLANRMKFYHFYVKRPALHKSILRYINSKFISLQFRYTKHTACSDEIYKQTFLQDCGLRIVPDNLRYIDWSARQSSPKSLKPEDFDSIVASGKLLARKFDSTESASLVKMILERISD